MSTISDPAGAELMAATPTVLYGRDAEQAVVDRLIADARDGRSSALVIRGEAGIGKTALLDYATSRANSLGLHVIRSCCVESELGLSFAGAQLLLAPVLDRLAALPPPQQDALRGALGLGPAPCNDHFLIGLAVLSLLADLAGDGPVLCLVDDAHWLDQTSADALLFAARRLQAEGVALVFATHDQETALFPAAGLPALRLGGLDADAATQLLLNHGGRELSREDRSRILEEANGNPLGLIELPAVYRSHMSVGARSIGVGPALTDRLRQAFRGQARWLPGATQDVLLIAAAEEGGDLRVVLDAAATFGATVLDLEPAERAGLVGVSDSVVTFRHPLVRAAVYHEAALGRRLAVHRALADALPAPADAARRAWHLAAAATGPDEAVAEELERTAADCEARNGYSATAAAYERAAQLSMDPTAQMGRLMLAAEAAAQIGDLHWARRLAARAVDHGTDPVQARLTSILGLIDFVPGALPAAQRVLTDNSPRIGRKDPQQAARLLANAVRIAWFLDDRAVMAGTADRLTALGESVGGPFASLVALLLRSSTEPVGQVSEDGLSLAELVAEARRSRAGDRGDLTVIAMASLVAGLSTEACELTVELVADARAKGRIGWLPVMLTCQAQALVLHGYQRDAPRVLTEALSIAQDTAQPQWVNEANAITAYLAAVAGDEQRCRELADTALAEPAGHVTSAARSWARWALGMLDLGQGRLEAAAVHLETVRRERSFPTPTAPRCVPDLVEAAVRLGQPERVAQPLAAFLAWAGRAGSPSTDALAHRCQALVTGGEEAERHYLAALERPEASFERARTQLLYGAWLRRARRKTESRAHLIAALDHLERAGATPWAQQARDELAATGATQPGQAGPAPLTPQERQVTRLAAQGLPNRDIAAQLFLSPRTVAYHLYKAYPKLGITSRTELDPDTLL
jgi:DNA-binding CsgD family transcriptional regulator